MEYLGTDYSEDSQITWNTIPAVKQSKYFGSIIQENGLSDLETEKNWISGTRSY
jgi:hypothetical protein